MQRSALFLVATFLLQLAPAFADDKQDYQKLIADNCTKELKSYCKGVQAGDARLLACLYAREDKLGGACLDAVLTSVDRLKTAIIAMSDVKRVCANDVRNLCPGVVAGKGHLVQCLTITQKRVSAACNTALDASFLR